MKNPKMPRSQDAKKVVARASFVETSPRKLRYVVDAVRHLQPTRAVEYLKAIPNRASKIVLKVYEQALGNAKNNFKLSPADLTVDSVQVHEGPRFKRRDAHAHGARFDSGVRHKKRAHITVILTSKEEAHGPKS